MPTLLFLYSLGSFLLLAAAPLAQAGSATWRSHPESNDWSDSKNWKPNRVPTDIASFGVSDTTNVSLAGATISTIQFLPGADAFTIRAAAVIAGGKISLTGEGVINESGITQNFLVGAIPATYLTFSGLATAGTQTTYSCEGGNKAGAAGLFFEDNASAGGATFMLKAGRARYGSSIEFEDTATAAGSTIICQGSARYGGSSEVHFFDSSTAGSATITCEGATEGRGRGGVLQIVDTASAGNATITAEGTDFKDAAPGGVVFYSNSTAANSTLIAQGGKIAGGQIVFYLDTPSGGTSRVEVFDNGQLIVDVPEVTIGSLEGDGNVSLGFSNLTIGANGLITTFSGQISGSGSVTKIGSQMNFASANTYSGGTTIAGDGELKVSNTSGSATGSGPVLVTSGLLEGTGIIAGLTTIGTDVLPQAWLAPGLNAGVAATLIIESSLTFQPQGLLFALVNADEMESDTVVANGVVIENGAQFDVEVTGQTKLATGASFTVISNTAATPISGTFANLPDGGTITTGQTTFQASYEGGDGNDLTLTVQ